VRSARIAAKYLTIGLILGLLLAPRSGAETRRRLSGRLTRLVQAVLGVPEATGPVTTV
jgi:hypothetical protein